jgi:cell division protein FtsB
LSVEAGQRVVCQLRIHNHGVQVDHFSIGLDGIPPSWVTLPRETLRLNPGESRTVAVALQPPRAPGSAAGEHPFTVGVRSQADPSQRAQAEGVLHVVPYHAITAQLSPQVISTGQARLTLSNQGNAPTQLSIAGTDPAEALTIRATPAQVDLSAGQRTEVPLQAEPRKGRPWLGTTQRYPFEVAVTAPAGQVARQGGTAVVRPIIPPWVLPLLGLLLIVTCIGAGVLYNQYNKRQEVAATAVAARATAGQATAVAAATQTASADSDGDGLTDAEEARLGTDPRAADTDVDGLSDGAETRQHGTNPLNADTDGDRLPDGEEIALGANPLVRDSDGDNVEDGREVYELGTSPINPDTDGDGTNDGADPDPGRAPTPTSTPANTSTPSPTEAPTATEVPALVIQVSADPLTIDKRVVDCTTLSWNIVNAQAVFLDGTLVPNLGQRQECPEETTRYTWRIVALDDSEQAREIEIEVVPAVAVRHLASWSAQQAAYYPDLATSWEANGDGSVWTFELRTAVTMADGRPFTADIVQETLDANPGAITRFGALVILDDYTIMIELTGPNPGMIEQISEIDFDTLPCPGQFDPDCQPVW